MKTLYLDIETYSATDLASAGVHRYAEDPSFMILMAAYSVDGGPVQIVTDPLDIASLPGLTDPDVEKVAHNAAFERTCMARYAGAMPAEHWRCTMALASEHGYPASLDGVAQALGCEQKDKAGRNLIKLFCVPNKHGVRNKPEDYPQQWEDFKRYCMQDVTVLVDVAQRLPDWPKGERAVWVADQRINDRGIQVDVGLCRVAVGEMALHAHRDMEELQALTGLVNPRSVQQLRAWLAESGRVVDDLTAGTVRNLLAGDLTQPQRRVLELRQGMAGTATKKFQAALDSVCTDGRFRGGFQFFGAHTGRWAGRRLQLQNLPRSGLASDAHTEAAVLDLMMGNGATPETLKALVRPMLVGPFTIVDYSAIEARVIAWLSGEEWVLEAFSAGRDIYVETAIRMGLLKPVTSAGTKEFKNGRFQGKVASLALGFGGGEAALQRMAEAYDVSVGNVGQRQNLVDRWRAANRTIVQFWYSLENAFGRGEGQPGDKIHVTAEGDSRFLWLPSGRALAYHGVSRRGGLSFLDPKKYGLRTGTYGGRLAENVTQAVARDVLAQALVRLDRGYPVVGHVHDEILVEGTYPIDEIADIMCRNPKWAEGLPLAAEGFQTKRYRKD